MKDEASHTEEVYNSNVQETVHLKNVVKKKQDKDILLLRYAEGDIIQILEILTPSL